MSARTETVQGDVGSFTWSTYYTAGFAYNTFAGQRRIDANTQARHAVAWLEWNDEVTVVVNNHARMVSQTRGRCKQTCPKPFPMDGAVVKCTHVVLVISVSVAWESVSQVHVQPLFATLTQI